MNMKQMKTVAIAAMVGFFALCWHTTSADTQMDENGVVWTYTVKDGVATVGGGSYFSPAISRSTTGDIIIPDTLGGCPVKAIAQCAFQQCGSIKSIVIPDSVTSIARSAFAYCTSMRKLKFGDGVTTINYGTGSQIIFASTSYTIFDNPFAGCSALVGIEFGMATSSVN